MSKFFLFTTLFAIGTYSFSQSFRIEGCVLDSNSQGIISSTVVFYDTDSTIITAVATDNNGCFALRATSKEAKGILEISHLSYLTQSIEVKKDTTITVYLQDKPYDIDEVTIVIKKPAIEFKDGNMIVNVSSIPNSSNSNIAKVLSRLPGVSANENDGLTLNGETATLYIDGRKQTLPFTSVISILQTLPASSIEQVELLTTATGRYDASHSGAIINLKTKKQKFDGYYLTLGGQSSMDDRDGSLDGGTNAFFMFKKKNVFFNASLSYRNKYWWNYLKDSLVYMNGAEMVRISDYTSRKNTYTGLANLAWVIKDKHSLNFNFFVYDSHEKGEMVVPIRVMNSSDDKDYIQSSKNRDHDDLWSGNIEYSSPDSLASKLVASYGIVYGGMRYKDNYYYQLFPGDEKDWYLYSNPQMVGNQQTGKVDFTQHFKKIGLKLLVGAKADIGKLNDDVKYYQNNTFTNYSDSHFTGKEIILGSYLDLIYELNDKWMFYSFIRMEHTNYDIHFKSDNTKVSDSYNNYFPYFHIYYKHSDNYQSILALLSTRILRPNYEHMLPGMRYSDAFSYTVGNPYLKPSLNRSLAWAHYLYGSGNVIFRYSHIKDVHGQIVTEQDNNIRQYTYMNYADARRFNVSINLPFEFFNQALRGNLSSYVEYLTLINSKNGFIMPENRNNFWKWNIKSTLSYNITKKLALFSWIGYSPPYKQIQFDCSRNWGLDLGVSYSMLRNNMLTIALEAENIFNTDKLDYVYYYDSNVLHTNTNWSNRFIKLSLSFKLSSGQNVIDKAKGALNDINRFRGD